jgi:hypothetical protein
MEEGVKAVPSMRHFATASRYEFVVDGLGISHGTHLLALLLK